MTAKTLTALRASIAHHEKNLKAKMPADAKLGPTECALCDMFWRCKGDDGLCCVGCPVSAKTGVGGCMNTPYGHLDNRHLIWSRNPESAIHKTAFLAAERAEIKFLKSLLPKGKK